MNWIKELDKFVLNYFKDEHPFEINGKPLKTKFFIGSPDTRSISEILSDVQDITYPVLIIARGPDTKGFELLKERNVPHTDGTMITLKRFVKDKYINTRENNVNLEIYRYKSPVFFNCEYRLLFFCEYAEHASEFETQFLERVSQNYIPIQSERFASQIFNVIWMFNENFSQTDNFAEAADTKREIKLSANLSGEGYFLALSSQKVIRGISTLSIGQELK